MQIILALRRPHWEDRNGRDAGRYNQGVLPAVTVAGDKPRLYIFCSHYSHVPTAAGTPRYEN